MYSGALTIKICGEAITQKRNHGGLPHLPAEKIDEILSDVFMLVKSLNWTLDDFKESAEQNNQISHPQQPVKMFEREMRNLWRICITEDQVTAFDLDRHGTYRLTALVGIQGK